MEVCVRRRGRLFSTEAQLPLLATFNIKHTDGRRTHMPSSQVCEISLEIILRPSAPHSHTYILLLLRCTFYNVM